MEDFLMELVSITVEGMSCNHCVKAIESAVGMLNGVENVRVDLQAKRVLVDFHSEKVSVDVIKGTIEDQGYIVK